MDLLPLLISIQPPWWLHHFETKDPPSSYRLDSSTPPVENINFIYGIYMYVPDTFSIADSYHQSFEFDKSATKNTHDCLQATSNLPRRLRILIAPSYGSFWIVGWCPWWNMPVNFCRGPIAWLRGGYLRVLGSWGAGVGRWVDGVYVMNESRDGSKFYYSWNFLYLTLYISMG